MSNLSRKAGAMLHFLWMIALVSAAYDTVSKHESDPNGASLFTAVALHPRRVHRRLSRDRWTVAPTPSPTGAPTAQPVAAPIVTVPVSSSAPVVPTAAPVRPPTAAPVVINATRAPTTRAPVISLPPTSSNTTLVPQPMVNLSNFDVFVTAITTGSTTEEHEEQLLLFRKEIRLVLESYLNRTMNLTDLSGVELRAIVSRTRFLQSSQSVEQLYSYAGAALFPNTTTTSLPDPAVVEMQQSGALSDTSAIQTELDESLQLVVTVQSISLWTLEDDNRTDDGTNGSDDATDDLSNSNNTTIIVTVAAGVAVLALALGCVVWRRVRHPAPRPPPLVTTSYKPPIPFSPYGQEEDDLDAHSIVRDLEKLEDLRNSSGGPPLSSPTPLLSEPYMQLDLSGTATSSEGDSPRGDDTVHTPPPIFKTNVNTMHVPLNDSNFYPNDTPEDELMGPASTTKTEPKALVDSNALYSAPVIQVTGSHDSMDGYSLTCGFYGGTKPLTLQTASPAPPPVVSPPQTKGSPSWMLKETPSDAYSSDSESNFSYTQIGIAPRISSSALGPTLTSMSMDSSDQVSFSEEDSILHLNHNVGVIADSPTFPDPRRTQHVYPDEDTPVITNARSALSHGTHMPAAPFTGGHDVRNLPEDFDDDSPLRATALAAHATASLNTSVASSAAAYNNISTGARIGDGDSQPSDEMMNDDSMAQDLEGFTEELDRIKRDIGISQQRSAALPITGRRILHAPSDEFGTAVVTPDEEWKRSSHYNVRQR